MSDFTHYRNNLRNFFKNEFGQWHLVFRVHSIPNNFRNDLRDSMACHQLTIRSLVFRWAIQWYRRAAAPSTSAAKSTTVMTEAMLFVWFFIYFLAVFYFPPSKRKEQETTKTKGKNYCLSFPVTRSCPDCRLLILKVEILTRPKVIWLQEWSVCLVFWHQSEARKVCLFCGVFDSEERTLSVLGQWHIRKLPQLLSTQGWRMVLMVMASWELENKKSVVNH